MPAAPEQVPFTVHATCIAIGGRAALLRGKSGSGKSDLALRCLAIGVTPLTPVPARLVADDRVLLTVEYGRLIAAAPPAIAGSMEVRGIGIVPVPATGQAEVVLAVDLDSQTPAERFPEVLPRDQLLGVEIPVLAVEPFHVAAALKVLMAIDRLGVAPMP